MKPEELLAQIKSRKSFPSHGWATDSDNCIYLVFPILRAIWELSETPSSVPLNVIDFVNMSYFQRSFSRILQVAGKIARAEELLLSGAARNGVSVEEWAPVAEAEEMLPIWVECFYMYFRVMADRLAVALGPLVLAGKAHASFPTEYKTLLKYAEAGDVPREWKMKVDASTFFRAIKDNRKWYQMLVGPINGKKKGIRDTIIHRLVQSIVVTEIDEKDTPKKICVRFERAKSDIPDIDILSGISDVISSFCDCLSALPNELWQQREFHVADLTFRAPGGSWPAATRFFPKLAL